MVRFNCNLIPCSQITRLVFKNTNSYSLNLSFVLRPRYCTGHAVTKDSSPAIDCPNSQVIVSGEVVIVLIAVILMR